MTIGSVPYLNASPLVAWFRTQVGRKSGIEVVSGVPSRLAQMLRNGDVACALVSSIELFRHPEWQVVSDIAIASTGRVLSVRLFSRVPLERVQSVALDTSSLTSSALVQVLFAHWWQAQPEYIPCLPELDLMLKQADAGLLIGDRGMLTRSVGLVVADLGEEWYRWTGLPFVWALWLGPVERLTPHLTDALLRARDWGLEHIDEVIDAEVERLGLDEALARQYLCEVMQYRLTPAHEEALARFGGECRRLGLVL